MLRLISPRVPALVFGAMAALALTSGDQRPPARSELTVVIHSRSPGARPASADAVDACAERRNLLQAAPALPGAPLFEAARHQILARARAEPVLFVEEPRAPEDSAVVTSFRAKLYGDPTPWVGFAEIRRELLRQPALLRKVLLTDGYLYAEQPAVAVLLTSAVTLNQLFEDRELTVMRGDRVLRAVRKHGEYVWADGPERGDRARLWLLDRVSAKGQKLGPALHLAIGDSVARLGADSIRIERLTRDAILVQLLYGDHLVPAILGTAQGRLSLECESVPEQARATVAAARSAGERRARVLSHLMARVSEQIDEALPFDEPKTEEGQQDGKLRPEWRTAYMRGLTEFTFNGDRYPVFDSAGRPRSPQVCADFIIDSWERLSGTRWLSRKEGRGRLLGRLNFSELGIENRRSVEQLIAFARARPEWFDLLEISEAERVPFMQRRRFYQRLFQLKDQFRPGDVVAILGPRDDELLHYHSFFIVAADPLTGMPTLLAANAGRPRIRTWEGELESAPRRAIVARIRPKLEWLERLAGLPNDAQGALPSAQPPPG